MAAVGKDKNMETEGENDRNCCHVLKVLLATEYCEMSHFEAKAISPVVRKHIKLLLFSN